MSWKALSGVGGGAALVSATLFVAWGVHAEYSLPGLWLTILVGLSGVALGWLLGFLASPYGPKEGERFAKYASLISLFLSGYALAKIDPVLDKVLSGALSDIAYGLRIGVFATCLLPSAITMYVFRLYTGFPDPGIPQKAAGQPNKALQADRPSAGS